MKQQATAARRPLASAFYARDTVAVARALIGCTLVSTIDGERVEGLIVETEAYIGPHDPASHAAERIGRTRRNNVMFGPPGRAYIYRIYGMHWCLNAVTEREGYPAAVLIRALEPTRGLKTMRRRRWPSGEPGPDRLLASGPGKLAAAFGITGALDGHDLSRAPLFVLPASNSGIRISTSPRIGVTRAADWPLRFCLAGSQWISRR